jgi:hypothetical protein
MKTGVLRILVYHGDGRAHWQRNLMASSIQYVVNVIFTLPTILFPDRVGRRPALLFGSTFMVIWLYAIAGTMKTYGHNVPGGLEGSSVVTWIMDTDTPHAKGAVITFTYLLVATYRFNWAPISSCHPPELFPVRLRGKAVSLATPAKWAFGFAISYAKRGLSLADGSVSRSSRNCTMRDA